MSTMKRSDRDHGHGHGHGRLNIEISDSDRASAALALSALSGLTGSTPSSASASASTSGQSSSLSSSGSNLSGKKRTLSPTCVSEGVNGNKHGNGDANTSTKHEKPGDDTATPTAVSASASASASASEENAEDPNASTSAPHSDVVNGITSTPVPNPANNPRANTITPSESAKRLKLDHVNVVSEPGPASASASGLTQHNTQQQQQEQTPTPTQQYPNQHQTPLSHPHHGPSNGYYSGHHMNGQNHGHGHGHANGHHPYHGQHSHSQQHPYQMNPHGQYHPSHAHSHIHQQQQHHHGHSYGHGHGHQYHPGHPHPHSQHGPSGHNSRGPSPAFSMMQGSSYPYGPGHGQHHGGHTMHGPGHGHNMMNNLGHHMSHHSSVPGPSPVAILPNLPNGGHRQGYSSSSPIPHAVPSSQSVSGPVIATGAEAYGMVGSDSNASLNISKQNLQETATADKGELKRQVTESPATIPQNLVNEGYESTSTVTVTASAKATTNASSTSTSVSTSSSSSATLPLVAKSSATAFANAQINIDADGSYKRKDKSLGVLCINFMMRYNKLKLLDPSSTPAVSIDEAAQTLQVERRRIYDIINILEAINVVSRKCKNTYNWHGMDNIETTFVDLQKEALLLFKEDAAKNGFDANISTNAGATGSTEGFADGTASGTGSQQEEPKLPTIRTGLDLLLASAEQVDLTTNAKGYKKPKPASKEKSLGRLSQKFIQLFLVGNETIALNDASDKILGKTPVPEPPAGSSATDVLKARNKANKMLKTKIRRLYDIANVMASIGLIAKLNGGNNLKKGTGRPSFKWIYSVSPRDYLVKQNSKQSGSSDNPGSSMHL